jgi:ABC-type spermidine/putrescine transport system permease subunit I
MLFFLVLPLGLVLEQSFRTFVPGEVGAAEDAPWTLQNYRELLHPAYFHFFIDTFFIALIATIAGISLSLPFAYFIARQQSRKIRTAVMLLLIIITFLSVLVRVYSFAVTLGPLGFGRDLLRAAHISLSGSTYSELMVVLGLLHYTIPISTLILIGTFQNISERFVQAAMALGAPAWQAHLTVTLPLSLPGILSAFLLSYALSISSFVVPMILGAGRVLFVSNLIYARLGEMANYPSGSAIAVILLLTSAIIVYVTIRIARLWDHQQRVLEEPR